MSHDASGGRGTGLTESVGRQTCGRPRRTVRFHDAARLKPPTGSLSQEKLDHDPGSPPRPGRGRSQCIGRLEWHSSDCRASCTQTQALSHLPQCSRRLSWIFITDDRNWPPNLLKGKEATL